MLIRRDGSLDDIPGGVVVWWCAGGNPPLPTAISMHFGTASRPVPKGLFIGVYVLMTSQVRFKLLTPRRSILEPTVRTFYASHESVYCTVFMGVTSHLSTSRTTLHKIH